MQKKGHLIEIFKEFHIYNLTLQKQQMKGNFTDNKSPIFYIFLKQITHNIITLNNPHIPFPIAIPTTDPNPLVTPHLNTCNLRAPRTSSTNKPTVHQKTHHKQITTCTAKHNYEGWNFNNGNTAVETPCNGTK
jgi:hypothetical protein